LVIGSLTAVATIAGLLGACSSERTYPDADGSGGQNGAAGAMGSAGAGGDSQGSPLKVVSTSPADEEDAFDPGASIEITFSAGVAEASVASSTLQLVANGTPIDVTVTVNGAVVKVQPKQRLALLGSYELSLGEDIASSHGAKLGTATSLSFKTRDGVWSEATPFQDDAKGSVANLRILPKARVAPLPFGPQPPPIQ
jgi:hypothetical protein